MNSVIAAVPDLDTVQFCFDRRDQIRATGGRMRQHSNATGIVDPVNKLFHVGGIHSFGDAVTEDVNSSTGKSELQSGNHNKVSPRERLTVLDVSMHSDVVEHFGMIRQCS